MSKHTPGPWELVDHEHEPAEIRDSETGMQVAQVFCTDYDFGKADAALIAAAPDLLAALERLLQSPMLIGNSREAGEAYRDCRAAIAKARGEVVSS